MYPQYTTIEAKEDIWFEQSNYIATHIAAVCYGAHVVTFFITARHILRWRSSATRQYFWFGFLFTLLAAGTVNIVCSIKFNQCAWIDERNFPGGPSNFLRSEQWRPILTVGNATYLIVTFLADGLLLYRVVVLWNYVWYIVAFPILFYIASISLAVLTVIEIGDRDFARETVDLSLPTWIILMVNNIVLTAMIVVRILIMRREIKPDMGKEYAKVYGTIASVVVEAALPFTILSVVLLALYGGRNATQNIFIPLLVQVECLAPGLIILHVIVGGNSNDSDYTPESSASSKSLEFAYPHQVSITPPPDKYLDRHSCN